LLRTFFSFFFLFVRLFVCSFVYLFALSFICPFVSSFVRSLFFRSFVRLFVRYFFVRSFVRSVLFYLFVLSLFVCLHSRQFSYVLFSAYQFSSKFSISPFIGIFFSLVDQIFDTIYKYSKLFLWKYIR